MNETAKGYLPKRLLDLYSLLSVARVKVVKWIPKYDEDRLMTAHNCDFMKDSHFIRCYDLSAKLGLIASKTNRWSTYIACWAADRAKHLDGDFVECGVNTGFLSRTVMEYIDFKNFPKKFYLIDANAGTSDASRYEQAKSTFREFDNVSIAKGTIPEVFSDVTPTRVSYLSIDLNSIASEITAAEYFWDKLVSGAMVILNNHGRSGGEDKHGFDEFAKRKKVPLLCLPTGQGLLLKS